MKSDIENYLSPVGLEYLIDQWPAIYDGKNRPFQCSGLSGYLVGIGYTDTRMLDECYFLMRIMKGHLENAA